MNHLWQVLSAIVNYLLTPLVNEPDAFALNMVKLLAKEILGIDLALSVRDLY